MKNKFKNIFKILYIILIIPVIFLMTGCEDDDELRIKSIERTGFDLTSVTYTITYTDGSTFEYTVPSNNCVSISSIVRTSSINNVDIYTITLSNGETTNFEVINGVSISSVEYDHQTGLRDYYKVNYSNGTHSFFSILNGKDGKDGVSLEDMYEEINATKPAEEKYNSIVEFIQDYLVINANSNSSAVATGKALLSSVSIYSEYSVSGSSWGLSGYVTQKDKSHSAGAGVIYQLDKENGDAYIITNCHVVYNENAEASGATIDGYSDNIHCYLYGQESFPVKSYDENGHLITDSQGYPVIDYGENAIECELVGASKRYDIAVLKVRNSEILKNSSARQVDVCNSNDTTVGSLAIAVGNPDADGISATVGHINVDSEYILVDIDPAVTSYLREFRIDTPVNSGNSGGGLFNDNGELIGIVNAKTANSDMENIGHAIPSNTAVGVANNLIYNSSLGYEIGKIARLGVITNIKSSKSYYSPEKLTTLIEEVVEIESVEEGSLAETLNMQAGYEFVKVYHTNESGTQAFDISRQFYLFDILINVKVGETLVFEMKNGGETLQFTHQFQEEDFVEFL